MREETEDGTQCVYVTQQEGGEVLTIDPAQLAQLMPDHVSTLKKKNNFIRVHMYNFYYFDCRPVGEDSEKVYVKFLFRWKVNLAKKLHKSSHS